MAVTSLSKTFHAPNVQCGEEYLNGATLQNIEHILETLKNMLTEIAVVDYRKAA